MKKYIPLIIIVSVILLLGVLYFIFFTEASSEDTNSSINESSATSQTSAPIDGQPVDQAVAEDAGYYISYSDYQSNSGMYNDGKVVYFFNASWCPTCKVLNDDISGNLTSIPSGVAIVSVDYDQYNDLKKQYGVTYQHTLVQVDQEGNLIKKWSGGNTLDSVLQQI